MNIEEFKVGNYLVSIQYDEFPLNPRKDMSFLGKLCLLHRRYDLWNDTTYKEDQFSNWGDLEETLREEYDAVVILPVFMYDHGGITVSTKPFSCRWDSGQVGYTFITRGDFIKEYGEVTIGNVQEKTAKAESLLIAELEVYSKYLNGEIYGYVVENKNSEVEDSCWGFYDFEDCKIQAGLTANMFHERDLKGPEFDYSI